MLMLRPAVIALALLAMALVAAPVIADDEPAPAVDPAVAPAPAAPLISTPAAPAIRAKFTDTKKKADQAATGTDGLAIWQAFVADNPRLLPDLAQKELAAWKERADKNLARLGTLWLPKEQVDERIAKASDLLLQAQSTHQIDEAIKLYDRAAEANPSRMDIPFKKGLACYKAKRFRESMAAFGDVIQIDADHLAARNNVAVLAAQQQQWGVSASHLAKAASLADNEAVLDNLDQVAWMAEQAGLHESAADADRKLRAAIAKLQSAGKHAGETRWGAKWIPEAEFRKLVKENNDIDTKTKADQARIDGLKPRYLQLQRDRDANQRDRQTWEQSLAGYQPPKDQTAAQTQRVRDDYRQWIQQAIDRTRNCEQDLRRVEDEVAKLKSDISAIQAKRNAPPHAGKLVLLESDTAQGDAVDIKGDDEVKPKPAVPKPPAPKPAAKPAVPIKREKPPASGLFN